MNNTQFTPAPGHIRLSSADDYKYVLKTEEAQPKTKDSNNVTRHDMPSILRGIVPLNQQNNTTGDCYPRGLKPDQTEVISTAGTYEGRNPIILQKEPPGARENTIASGIVARHVLKKKLNFQSRPHTDRVSRAPPCRFLFLLFSRRDKNASTPSISTSSDLSRMLPANSSVSTLESANNRCEMACNEDTISMRHIKRSMQHNERGEKKRYYHHADNVNHKCPVGRSQPSCIHTQYFLSFPATGTTTALQQISPWHLLVFSFRRLFSFSLSFSFCFTHISLVCFVCFCSVPASFAPWPEFPSATVGRLHLERDRFAWSVTNQIAPSCL